MEEGEKGGKKREEKRREWNRAHVRSPQAQRVKGRDAKGEANAVNREKEWEGTRWREKGTRLEDRQTRGGLPLARRVLLSDNANQLSHFNVLFPLFGRAGCEGWCRWCCQCKGTGWECEISFLAPIVIAKLSHLSLSFSFALLLPLLCLLNAQPPLKPERHPTCNPPRSRLFKDYE